MMWTHSACCNSNTDNNVVPTLLLYTEREHHDRVEFFSRVQQAFDRDTYLSKSSLWNGYTKLKHYLSQRKVQTFIISVCVWALRIMPKASCIMLCQQLLEMKLYYAHTMLNYVMGFNLWPKGQAQVLKIEYGLWLHEAVNASIQ